MTRQGSWNELFARVVAAAAEAGARRFAEHVVDDILGSSVHEDDFPPARPARQAVNSYLKGDSFAAFNRRRVVSWTIHELGRLPRDEAAGVMRAAAAASRSDDVDSTLKALTRILFTSLA